MAAGPKHKGRLYGTGDLAHTYKCGNDIFMKHTKGDGEGVNVGIRDNPRASTDDGDGVDASTKDGPCALTSDGVSLASIGGGDGVGATSRGLTSIDTEDGDGVDDGRISRGGNSLTIYRLFFAVFPFPLD